MTNEGFLRLFEAMMEQAHEDASYEGNNAERIEYKKDAIAFIEKMKKDFAK